MTYIGSLIKKTYLQAKEGKMSPENIFTDIQELPLDEEKYATAFKKDFEYLKNNFLSASFLKARLRFLHSNFLKIKKLYPEGYILALGVFPSTEMGYPLSNEQIKDHRYFYELFVDQNGLTYNFSFIEGAYFSILPKKIQQECSFSIHYTNDPKDFVSPEDFAKIYNSYIDAYNNLRKFFGLPALAVEKLDS